MKKILKKLLAMVLVALMVFGGGFTVLAASEADMVPLRYVFEAAGAEVGWDDDSRRAIVEIDGQVLYFYVGTNDVIRNGEALTTAYTIVLDGGSTMISQQDLAALMGEDHEVTQVGAALFQPFSATITTVVNTVNALMASNQITGASVAVVDANTGFIWTQGFGYADTSTGRLVDEHTIFNLASLSKPLTATAVFQLVDAGIIDLDEPIVTYLPQFSQLPALNGGQPGDYALVTTRMLLGHVSGIMGDFRGYGTFTLDGYDRDFLNNLLGRLANYHMTSPPNTMWTYNNHAFNVLGVLVATMAGDNDNFAQGFEDYMAQNIFGPAGMINSTFLVEDDSNLAMPYFNATTPAPRLFFNGLPTGGVFSSAHDMGRWMLFMLGGGEFDGVRLISAESEAMMRTFQDFDFSLNHFGITSGHAYLNIAAETGLAWWGHGGTMVNYFSHMAFDFEGGLGVFVTTNSTTGAGSDSAMAVTGLIAAITETGRIAPLVLSGRPARADEDAEPIQIPAYELEAFVGLYLGDGLYVPGYRVITLQGDYLYITLSSAPGTAHRLTPMSDGRFASEVGPVWFDQVDWNGELIGVTLSGNLGRNVNGVRPNWDDFAANEDFAPWVGTFAAQMPANHRLAAPFTTFNIDEFGIAYQMNHATAEAAGARTPVRNVGGTWNIVGVNNVVFDDDGYVISFNLSGMDFVRED